MQWFTKYMETMEIVYTCVSRIVYLTAKIRKHEKFSS